MTEFDPGWLVTPDLDAAKAERIRRRGQRVLAAPGATPGTRVEAVLVVLFSVMTLGWAASAVILVG